MKLTMEKFHLIHLTGMMIEKVGMEPQKKTGKVPVVQHIYFATV